MATSTTDPYQLLLIQYLNMAKDEAEASWDWHALRTTVTLTVSAGTSEYDLLASGPSDVDVGIKARLLYENPVWAGMETSKRSQGALPQVFDTTDASEYRLTEVTPEEMERLHFTDNDEQQQPTCFALWRDADNIKVKLFPVPEKSRTVKLRFVIPQAEVPSSSMATYTLSIPENAVWPKALLMALEERGEDTGRPTSAVAMQADRLLADAIAAERTDEDDTGVPV